ncbi:beta-glucosidase 26-like [Phragmites australis]|uniref:beta-glucosidase 26-like n=1 Tax=Phragmites australis TaxID=29695 RepID=UPI002D7A1F2E|nr:beta-glucosidase 26-like [Phragmites australis]
MHSTMKLRAQVIVLAAAAHVRLTLPTAQCYWLNPEIYDTGGLSQGVFPEGFVFVFGTAASAYQVEGMSKQGGRRPSIWDAFIEVPGTIPDNVTADVTVDEYHRYKEDMNIMKNLSFDAYRFSISWSRIFPSNSGQANQEGVEYNRLIYYMIQQGIALYANLYHYDLPLALHEQHLGWLSPKIVEAFADYADFCLQSFGDRVKNRFTFNEPRCVAAQGYDNGYNAPGRCSSRDARGNSTTEQYLVAHHLILSHAAAVKRYLDKYQLYQKGRIVILLDFVRFEPFSDSNADQAAALRARDFHLGWFLHPITYGRYAYSMLKIVKDRMPATVVSAELICFMYVPQSEIGTPGINLSDFDSALRPAAPSAGDPQITPHDHVHPYVWTSPANFNERVSEEEPLRFSTPQHSHAVVFHERLSGVFHAPEPTASLAAWGRARPESDAPRPSRDARHRQLYLPRSSPDHSSHTLTPLQNFHRCTARNPQLHRCTARV